MTAKQIYTGNYSLWGKEPLAYGITGVLPAWLPDIHHLPRLSPTWNMVSQYKRTKITERQFTEMYYKLLEQRKLDAQQVADSLPSGAILCCYERPEEFCHRHLLADWLRRNSQVVIEEKT